MTVDEAAAWMFAELNRDDYLDQQHVVWELDSKESGLTYENDAGNLAISVNVLEAFRILTGENDVVWSRSERQWRWREGHDEPGRMQS